MPKKKPATPKATKARAARKSTRTQPRAIESVHASDDTAKLKPILEALENAKWTNWVRSGSESDRKEFWECIEGFTARCAAGLTQKYKNDDAKKIVLTVLRRVPALIDALVRVAVAGNSAGAVCLTALISTAVDMPARIPQWMSLEYRARLNRHNQGNAKKKTRRLKNDAKANAVKRYLEKRKSKGLTHNKACQETRDDCAITRPTVNTYLSEAAKEHFTPGLDAVDKAYLANLLPARLLLKK